MSVRYEWMHLPNVTSLPDGYDVSTDEPADEDSDPDRIVDGGALILSADEVVVVQGDPELLIEWAQGVLREARRLYARSTSHKAQPTHANSHDQPCGVCGDEVHKVPGGQGSIWVHKDSGMVLAKNPRR